MRTLITAAIAVYALTLTANCGAAEEATAPKAVVGQPAPEFSLVDTTGKKRSLSEFKGKFVVLEWVNYDCPFVRKHYGAKNMQSLQAAYTAKDVVWLSICSSAPGKQGHFEGQALRDRIKKEESHTTAYLSDPDGKVGKLYGAKTTPHMYIVDPAGSLIYAGGIDDKPTADVDDIAKATNYVRVGLDAALAGKKLAVATSQPYGCSVKY